MFELRTPPALVSSGNYPWASDEVDTRVIVAMGIAPNEDGGHVAFVVPEGLKTSDRRSIDLGALSWRNPPLPLMFIDRYTYGHDEAEFVGNLVNFRKQEVNGTMWVLADVEWDNELGDDGDWKNETASEAFRLVDSGKMRGISADITDVVADLVVHEMDEDGWPTDWEEVIRSGVVAAATIVPIPAFADAHIARKEAQAVEAADQPEDALAASGIDLDKVRVFSEGNITRYADDTVVVEFDPDQAMTEDDTSEPVEEATQSTEAELADVFEVSEDKVREALLAAMVEMPDPYPSEWFTDPGFEGPTAKTVTSDGRVFGHMALWESCHTAYADACVTPPRQDDFSSFLLGEIDTEDGAIPVGVLTMNTGHANMAANPRDTIAHYDNTGTIAAYVNVGADDHGIWFSGVLAPNLSAEQVRVFKASKLSGDWRALDSNGLSLVAVLAVNTPGFPVARVASAAQLSLVAAGVPDLDPVTIEAETPADPEALSNEDLMRAMIRFAHHTFKRIDKVAGTFLPAEVEVTVSNPDRPDLDVEALMSRILGDESVDVVERARARFAEYLESGDLEDLGGIVEEDDPIDVAPASPPDED